MKSKIIRYFNQGALTYDAAAAVQIHVAKQLSSHLNDISAKKILEIGCGTGLYSCHLLSLFPKASFWLTDISPEMVKTCEKKFFENNQVKVACIDGERIGTQMTYDLISSSMTFHWFDNIKLSLEKLINKLAPGGKLVFSILGENSLSEWRDICEKFQVRIGTPLFPSSKLLGQWFPNLNIFVENFQYHYEKPHAFLDSLKKLGARASHKQHSPVSISKLRHLLRQASRPLPISYEIIYGSYTRI